MSRKRLARLQHVAVESVQSEIFTMQADGSVFVSELAVAALVLARLLAANVAHGGLLVALLYSTQSTHYPVRLPTTTHVPKCY